MSMQRPGREPHTGTPRRSVGRAAAGLAILLGLLSSAPAARAGTMLHFRDAQGIDHYVDQADEVPPGAHAEPVDLSKIPLNQGTARKLELRSTEALTRAAREVPAGSVSAPPPREAQIYGVVALGLALAFLALTLALAVARPRLGALALPLGLLRVLCGTLTLVALAGCAYELRGSTGWFAEHFPPLKAFAHAKAVTDSVNAKQKANDQQIEGAFRGNQ